MDMNKVEYLARMENVLEIPAEDRLTHWYGDYDLWEPKLNITEEQINNRIKELDAQIEHGPTYSVEITETLQRIVPVENARSMKEAIDIVMQDYNSGNLILNAEDFKEAEFTPAGAEYEAAVEEAMEAAAMEPEVLGMEM